MKFKIDENLPIEFADILKAAGYDATTVFDEKLQGKRDSIIADICRLEGRILVTLDTDFAGASHICKKTKKSTIFVSC